jgi:SAM-dependent methyltransferase
MYSISDAGFVDSNGRLSRSIDLGRDEASGAWQRRQDNALPGYRHELSETQPVLQKLYRSFSWYIATAILQSRPASILDVGCGISSRHPPYIEPLRGMLQSHGILYTGLDPMCEAESAREYFFVRGRVEDAPEQIEHRFGMFLFSTSLDHFEDLDQVARAVRRLAARGARCVFWIGLHDPALVAGEIGRKWFSRLYQSMNPAAFLGRALIVNAVMLYRYPSMLARWRALRRGAPLDELHFHFFTRDNVRDALARFGEIRDLADVPGTSSIFATVDVTAAAGG